MKYQDEYYNAISKCHVNGKSTFFIEFMLKQIDSVLEEIVTQINEDSEQLSDCVRKLLDVMEYDVAYASNQLMEKLELKSREGFRRNYLKPALELNLVSMTIPDKPNSKNQR
ncbi:MAG: Fic family protein [Eubacterium ventriosum]